MKGQRGAGEGSYRLEACLQVGRGKRALSMGIR